ncbi:NAD-dependent DNA ligase LigA [Kitasatospora sp. NPDC002551]|uniref:NAD-dependent DNA ligase LigA n=1 Tax=Kitasatospora sp. NPDC002551 TaxID=3154539 RepID=UPI00332A5ED8
MSLDAALTIHSRLHRAPAVEPGSTAPTEERSSATTGKKDKNVPNTLAPITDEDSYLRALDQARSAAAAYYGGGDSQMDDASYDRLMSAIASFEQEHPDQRAAESPTTLVAAGALPEGSVVHATPMLSLDNVFDAGELARWVQSLGKRLGSEPRGLHAGPKIDGLAVAAHYHEGKLVQLVTRGTGTTGEDVSHAIGTIDGLPVELDTPVSVEVRGEVVLLQSRFEEANRIRVAHGEDPFSNPRNAASGSLRATGRKYTIPLSFYGYGLLPAADGGTDRVIHEEMTHTELMKALGSLGVQTVDDTPVGTLTSPLIADIQAYVEKVAAQRADLPVGIDGIVVKADHPQDQAVAGSGSRAPRWAVAFKLPALEVISTLTAVTWTTGRTGNIAPRGEVEPVEIEGVRVQFATLHNPGMIARLGLRIGDRVVLRRAGDVIPQILAPITSARTGQETPIELPTVCPGCGGEIDKSQERWRCLKGRACNLAASITYAVQRDVLDIQGIGPKVVAQLVAQEAVQDVADLFTLTLGQLTEATGSEKTAAKILDRIAAAKQRPLARVLCALGVRGTGRSMSRRIAEFFGTMAAIQAASAAELRQVEGIGAEKSAWMLAELAELEPVIAKLAAAGVNLGEPKDSALATGSSDSSQDVGAGLPLAGKTIVVTGAMTGRLEPLSRTGMNELIEKAGGRSGSSVSKKSTSLVVAGDKAGSKKEKAKQLGIPVIGPDEFAQMVSAYL